MHFELELTHVVTTNFILDTFMTHKRSPVGQLSGALPGIHAARKFTPISLYTVGQHGVGLLCEVKW